MSKPRVIVAISGASGAIYGIKALALLRELGSVETHLVVSPAGARTILEETDFTPDQVDAMADVCHAYRDIAAPPASGSPMRSTTHAASVAPRPRPPRAVPNR